MPEENFIWLDLNRLIWEFLHPAIQSYQFRQYQTSADYVYWANCLLNGLAEGLELDPPKAVIASIQDRRNPLVDYKTYVTKNMPGIAKSLGMIVAASFKKIGSRDYGTEQEHKLPEELIPITLKEISEPPIIKDPPGA